MKNKKLILSPSVLAADFSNLEKEISKINKYNIEYMHIDVMDGHFVPNISFGPKITADIKKLTSAKIDIHLMIENVDKYAEEFIKLKPDIITFHIEAVKFYFRLINFLKKNNIKVGIALNPGTPLSSLENLYENIDLVLIMSVDPGFYGQSYINNMTSKIKNLYNIRKEKKYKFLIEVDGGINEKTINLVKPFADMVVLGKAFFKNENLDNFMNSI